MPSSSQKCHGGAVETAWLHATVGSGHVGGLTPNERRAHARHRRARLHRRLDDQDAARRRRGARRLRPRRRAAPAPARDDARGARAGRARGRRRHRSRRARAGPRRARDHARDPPRRAAGAVLPRRPGARRARQRRRHRERVRGREATPRPDPGRDLRELGRRLRRRRPVARPGDGRHAADDALRRLQARERGDGPGLLGRRRRPVDRPPAVRRVRRRPRPGDHLDADAGDGRRRRAARGSRSPSAVSPSTTTRPTWRARSCRRAAPSGRARVRSTSRGSRRR